MGFHQNGEQTQYIGCLSWIWSVNCPPGLALPRTNVISKTKETSMLWEMGSHGSLIPKNAFPKTRVLQTCLRFPRTIFHKTMFEEHVRTRPSMFQKRLWGENTFLEHVPIRPHVPKKANFVLTHALRFGVNLRHIVHKPMWPDRAAYPTYID